MEPRPAVTRTLTFPMPGRALFTNRVLRAHWSVRHRLVAAHRQHCRAIVNHYFATLPDWGRQYQFAWVEAEVVFVLPEMPDGRRRKRSKWPDNDGCLTASKAMFDALVDQGVLVDDGPEYVRSVTVRQERPPTGPEEIRVTLKGEPR